MSVVIESKDFPDIEVEVISKLGAFKLGNKLIMLTFTSRSPANLFLAIDLLATNRYPKFRLQNLSTLQSDQSWVIVRDVEL